VPLLSYHDARAQRAQQGCAAAAALLLDDGHAQHVAVVAARISTSMSSFS
jgi:hypothetical protein